MLVTELKAKVKKRGLYYNKWLPVLKFMGTKIVLGYYTEKVELDLKDIERIEY